MQLAQAAYRSGAQGIKTPRSAEYEAFARITSRLKAANDTRSPARFSDLAGAIHDNRKLWTILASDAAGSDNGLPGDLRARILFLAEFTRQHSQKVLRSGAPVAPLLEINRLVMSGLHERSARK